MSVQTTIHNKENSLMYVDYTALPGIVKSG